MTAVRQPDQESGDANYRYWREAGSEWFDEYARRKQTTPLYHVQEIMLTDYFLHQAPARVLEYGCGVGRHLRNLCSIAELEVHGYDQSVSMAQGCLNWTDQAWIDDNIRVGPPVGRLPYEDDSFDVVYTTEVLVHVRPDDLGHVLSELIRVCRGHLLHLETSDRHEVNPDAHAGCWNHDLIAAYRHLGRNAEVLPAGYFVHDPVRVILDPAGPGDPKYVWPEPLLALYRRLDQQLGDGIRDLKREKLQLRKRVDRLRSQHTADDQRVESTTPPVEPADEAPGDSESTG